MVRGGGLKEEGGERGLRERIAKEGREGEMKGDGRKSGRKGDRRRSQVCLSHALTHTTSSHVCIILSFVGSVNLKVILIWFQHCQALQSSPASFAHHLCHEKRYVLIGGQGGAG